MKLSKQVELLPKTGISFLLHFVVRACVGRAGAFVVAIFSSILAIVFTIPVFAQNGPVDDIEITSNTHLGNITINDGGTLRVHPGVQASFDRITNHGTVVVGSSPYS